ncbi:MAG: LuxR C-terminal-related transcriptional regulator [Burkholderiaceae bacterium]
MPEKSLIALVDDHPLVRRALSDALRATFPGLEIATTATVEEAMFSLRRRLTGPDIQRAWVLLDLGLPGLSGLAAIMALKALDPRVTILSLSGSDDDLQVGACLGCGSYGFISKGAPIEDLLTVITDALHGRLLKGTWLSSVGLRDSQTLEKLALTERQLQVLSMVCQGKTNRQIADGLGITEITAKAHIGAIFRALKVSSRTQAVLLAQRIGVAL